MQVGIHSFNAPCFTSYLSCHPPRNEISSFRLKVFLCSVANLDFTVSFPRQLRIRIQGFFKVEIRIL
jgi:hypothetical protein